MRVWSGAAPVELTLEMQPAGRPMGSLNSAGVPSKCLTTVWRIPVQATRDARRPRNSNSLTCSTTAAAALLHRSSTHQLKKVSPIAGADVGCCIESTRSRQPALFERFGQLLTGRG